MYIQILDVPSIQMVRIGLDYKWPGIQMPYVTGTKHLVFKWGKKKMAAILGFKLYKLVHIRIPNI